MKRVRNQKTIRHDYSLILNFGWLFADLLLALAMVFLLTINILPSHPNQPPEHVDIPLFSFVSQHPLITIGISIAILLVPASFLFATSQLRKRKSRAASMLKSDVTTALTVPGSEKRDTPKIELIKEWIQQDEKLKNDLKTLFVSDLSLKSTQLAGDTKLLTIEERLSLLEKRWLQQEKEMQSQQKKSFYDWLGVLNNITSILIALPSIAAIVLAIIAILHNIFHY